MRYMMFGSELIDVLAIDKIEVRWGGPLARYTLRINIGPHRFSKTYLVRAFALLKARAIVRRMNKAWKFRMKHRPACN